MNRQAAISIDGIGSKFQLLRFESEERLSQPFRISLEGYSEDDIDFLDLLGNGASIEVADQGAHSRYFHGVLTEAALLRVDGAGSHYRLTLQPWFHLLKGNRLYRVFQEKTVIEIARQIFSDLGFSGMFDVKVHATFRKRDYCVQYKESDFTFLSRLFEDEGIYYFFEHEQASHKLILCDAPSAHGPTPGFEALKLRPVESGQAYFPDSLGGWNEVINSNSQSIVTLNSYDFERPSADMKSKEADEAAHKGDKSELYEYVGDYVGAGSGARPRAVVRLEAARATRRVFYGVGDAPGLTCGSTLDLDGSPIDRLNTKYLLVAVRHQVEVEASRSGGGASPSTVTVEAIPHATPFRAPLATPRPRAYGLETAVVTGPAGEVIHVDKYGRVKVQFHWDREGKKDEKSSCWIRVSDGSAGKGFGHITLPRIGEEVVVDFLNGDPDQPLITGRVYNAEQTVPYALPANKTRSTWRATSVPASGTSQGFNEIRFENKDAAEEIYVHAQKDRLTDILNNDTLNVKNNRTTTITANEVKTVTDGDETHDVKKGKRTTTVFMDESLEVKQGDMKTTVKMGNVTSEVSMGNFDTKVKLGNYSLKADLGKIDLEAMQSIKLTVGQNSIEISQMGVTIKGMMIKSEAQIMHESKGLMMQNQASAMMTIKGAITMIN